MFQVRGKGKCQVKAKILRNSCKQTASAATLMWSVAFFDCSQSSEAPRQVGGQRRRSLACLSPHLFLRLPFLLLITTEPMEKKTREVISEFLKQVLNAALLIHP